MPAPDTRNAQIATPAATAASHMPDGPRRRDEFGKAQAFREATLSAAQVEDLLAANPGENRSLRLFADVTLELGVKGRYPRKGGHAVAADITGFPPGSRIFLSLHEGQLRGIVEIPSQNLAYEISGSSQKGYRASEWLFSDKVCASASGDGKSATAGIPRPPDRAASPPGARSIQAIDVPDLQSRPGNPRVIYLDFDGELVSGTAWNGGDTINALPARMTAAQIRETWERVVQCFEIFDVNVTTNRAVYDAAPDTSKTHSIISSTNDAAPSAGGVAWLDSFANPDPAYKINWTFNDEDPRDCTTIITHEVGHTLALNHDGRTATSTEPREEYYEGHGNGTTGWGPIMGAAYGRELMHWNNGDYPRANNPEDDLAIISAPQRIPLLPDDHSASMANATAVRFFPTGGSVSGNDDSDLFKLTLGAGTHKVSASRPDFSVLDIDLQILNASGATIATAAPPASLSANTTFTLSARSEITIRVRGSGKAAVPGDDGYSNYGSIGRYELSGPQPEPDLQASLNPSGNPAFSWSTGGNLKWMNETDSVRGEVAVSGPIGHNQKSHVQTALAGPGTITFWWKVSSQPTFDYLRLLLNGVEQARISGNTTWSQSSLVIPWGNNTVKWEYIKNGSVIGGSDAGWLDDVVFTPAGNNPPAAISVETSSGSIISSNATAPAFQVLGLTNNASQQFRIRNTGLASLSINSVSKNGTHAGDFIITTQPASSILPDGSSTLGIRFTPSASGNRTARIEITSNDPLVSPFILRLAGTATPTPLEGWRNFYFASLAGNGSAANTADPDRDGIPNLLEYALGSDPSSAASRNPVLSDTVTSGSKRHLRLYIDRRRDDLLYFVEASANLTGWTTIKTYEGIGTDSAYFTDTVDLNAPGPNTPRFLRVKVQER